MTSVKLWKRWDPRLGEPLPVRETKFYKHFVVEVVPDLFAPGLEELRESTLRALGELRYQDHGSRGRYLLRTAHPATAAAELRRISDRERGICTALRHVPSRVVLALYAETQAEFDERVRVLFAPRVKLEELALTDLDAAVKMALFEGWIHEGEFWEKEWRPVLAQGAEAFAKYLKSKVGYGHRTDGIPVDSGGLALYLSPRERIDVGPFLAAGRELERKHGVYPAHTFDWVICAGRVGPINADESRYVNGPIVDRPHPMHPAWIREIGEASRAVEVPFCVPYLGEWAEAQINAKVPHESVDYDPSWEWGTRGWDDEQRDAKPPTAYMNAIGSHLAGRAVRGQIFDEWPTDQWHPR